MKKSYKKFEKYGTAIMVGKTIFTIARTVVFVLLLIHVLNIFKSVTGFLPISSSQSPFESFQEDCQEEKQEEFEEKKREYEERKAQAQDDFEQRRAEALRQFEAEVQAMEEEFNSIP